MATRLTLGHMTDIRSRCVGKISTDTRRMVHRSVHRISVDTRSIVDWLSVDSRSSSDRVSTAMSTATSPDIIAVNIAVDITYSKHDPTRHKKVKGCSVSPDQLLYTSLLVLLYAFYLIILHYYYVMYSKVYSNVHV